MLIAYKHYVSKKQTKEQRPQKTNFDAEITEEQLE